MELPKYELKNDPSTQISCLCGKVTVIFHLSLLLSMEELRGTQRMPWLPVIVSLFHFLLSNQNQSFYFFNERKPFFSMCWFLWYKEPEMASFHLTIQENSYCVPCYQGSLLG